MRRALIACKRDGPRHKFPTEGLLLAFCSDQNVVDDESCVNLRLKIEPARRRHPFTRLRRYATPENYTTTEAGSISASIALDLYRGLYESFNYAVPVGTVEPNCLGCPLALPFVVVFPNPV
jgi:hypothetical protein